MKKNILVAFLLVASTMGAHAQYSTNKYPSVSTSVVDSARYEIVQSPIKRSLTFRLDKFLGSVCQLVKTSSGALSWEFMIVRDRYTIEFDKDLYPRFQIFMGGMMAADTYLLDTKTGKTWQLQESSDGSLSWNMLEEY